MKRTISAVVMLLAATAVSLEAGDAGRAKYESACAPCHGPRGGGDGGAAAAFPPGTVTNLRTGPFRYATDAGKVKEIVLKGGAVVGLSPLMPPQPSFTDRELDAVADFVLDLRE